MIGGRRPPSSSNGLLGRFVIYISQTLGGEEFNSRLLDFSRSTTFISSMKLKHLMVMKDVR